MRIPRALPALAIIALVSACTTMQDVAPGQVVAEVVPPKTPCGWHDERIRVSIRVKNGSQVPLELSIDERETGRPYKLSWLSYDVEGVPREDDDGRHGPGGHGPLPPDTLRIGPGDWTTVWAEVYDLDTDDYARSFRIRLKGSAGDQAWTTDAFRPCVAANP